VAEIFPELRPDEEERQGVAVRQDAFGPALLDENFAVRLDEPGNVVPAAVAHSVFAMSCREQKRSTELRQQDAALQARLAGPALRVEVERPDAAQRPAEHRASPVQRGHQLPEQLRALPQRAHELADDQRPRELEPKRMQMDELPDFRESRQMRQASPSQQAQTEPPRVAQRRA
jgi:hypothetical protein